MRQSLLFTATTGSFPSATESCSGCLLHAVAQRLAETSAGGQAVPPWSCRHKNGEAMISGSELANGRMILLLVRYTRAIAMRNAMLGRGASGC